MVTVFIFICLIFNIMVISLHWHNSFMEAKGFPFVIYTLQLISFVFLMYQIF